MLYAVIKLTTRRIKLVCVTANKDWADGYAYGLNGTGAVRVAVVPVELEKIEDFNAFDWDDFYIVGLCLRV